MSVLSFTYVISQRHKLESSLTNSGVNFLFKKCYKLQALDILKHADLEQTFSNRCKSLGTLWLIGAFHLSNKE